MLSPQEAPQSQVNAMNQALGAISDVNAASIRAV